jgi:hypothetical protein
MLHCKKLIPALVLFCFSAATGRAQAAFHFHSINQAGLLNGQAGSSWQLQTINGVQHRSWFAGIGAGLEGYRFRGIPLFVDLRKTFGQAKNKPFVYADAGIHFIWVTDKDKTVNGGSQATFYNGLYLDGGAGYEIHINRKNALLLSLGYSYKTIREKAAVYYYSPMPFSTQPVVSSYDTYHYYLNRLSIKAGWKF